MADPFSLFVNPRVSNAASPPPECESALPRDACAKASAEIPSWPGYRPTPLRTLPGMAGAAGIGALHYKDESGRFGLGSFKALGGAYAVYRYLAREIVARGAAASVTVSELAAGTYADIVSRLTVCCATDGNHGRSVAWGAQMFGCACVITLHQDVSPSREAAIACHGARVVRVTGNYDDSVRRAARDARSHGWQVISDTSYPGYTEIPREVMAGYTVMLDEVMRALPEDKPLTHVFVQGGVGGLAASVCANFWRACGAERPRLVVVEPENAACLYASAMAGEWQRVEGSLDTAMAGLSAGEPSMLAWPLIALGAHGFMCIGDDSALDAMRVLAAGVGGDSPIVGGESGVAGVAALRAVSERPESARLLGLDARSRVLVFGTEGDTDAALYTQIVGESGECVRARQTGEC